MKETSLLLVLVLSASVIWSIADANVVADAGRKISDFVSRTWQSRKVDIKRAGVGVVLKGFELLQKLLDLGENWIGASNKLMTVSFSITDMELLFEMQGPTWYYHDVSSNDRQRAIATGFPLVLRMDESSTFTFFVDDDNRDKEVCVVYKPAEDAAETLPTFFICFGYDWRQDKQSKIFLRFRSVTSTESFEMLTRVPDGGRKSAVKFSERVLGAEKEFEVITALSCDLSVGQKDECMGDILVHPVPGTQFHRITSSLTYSDNHPYSPATLISTDASHIDRLSESSVTTTLIQRLSPPESFYHRFKRIGDRSETITVSFEVEFGKTVVLIDVRNVRWVFDIIGDINDSQQIMQDLEDGCIAVIQKRTSSPNEGELEVNLHCTPLPEDYESSPPRVISLSFASANLYQEPPLKVYTDPPEQEYVPSDDDLELPVAKDDIFQIHEDDETLVEIDVLENDLDFDSVGIILLSVIASEGLATISPQNTSIDYLPNSLLYQYLSVDETAQFTLDYSIRGNIQLKESSATITINVIGGNDAPFAFNDSTSVTEGRSTIVYVDVLGNDFDVDENDKITVKDVSMQSSIGVATIADDKLTLSFYLHSTSFNYLHRDEEADFFIEYTIQDKHNGEDSAFILVQVLGENGNPNAVSDVYVVSEDTFDRIQLDVLENDSDPDEDSLTITETEFTGNGTVQVSENLRSLSFEIQTEAFQYLAVEETENLTLTYSVGDDFGGIATGDVLIVVRGVNDAPVCQGDYESMTEDDSNLLILEPLSNDYDIDLSDILRISSSELTGPGVLIADDTILSYELDLLAFQSLAIGQTGKVILSYVADDSNGGNCVGEINIEISGLNDDPIANDDSLTVTEDEEGAQIISVLSNDYDVDTADIISITDFESPVPNTVIPDMTQGFQFTLYTSAYQYLASGESKTVSFIYNISDNYDGVDSAKVTVVVAGLNDTPFAVNDSITISEDDSNLHIIDPLANDKDIDLSDTHKLASHFYDGDETVTLSDDFLTIYFQPLSASYQYLTVGESEILTIDYTMYDTFGAASSAFVNILIAGANDSPQAVDDEFVVSEDEQGTVLLDVLWNDSDVDFSDSLTIISVELLESVFLQNVEVSIKDGTSIAFAINSSHFQYLAESEFVELHLLYNISDNYGGMGDAVVAIKINGMNDAPVALNDELSFTEDETKAQVVYVLANDNDVDESDFLQLSTVEYPAIGNTSHSEDLQSIIYVPDPKYFQYLAVGETSVITIAYIAFDNKGKSSNTAGLLLSILGVNDAPFAIDDVHTIDENDVSIQNIPALLNDYDIDNSDSLHIVSVKTAGPGSVDIAAESTFVKYIPEDSAFKYLALGESATVVLNYTISDNNGVEDSAEIVVIVNGVNNVPVAYHETWTISEIETADQIIPVLDNDVDEDISDSLIVTSVKTDIGSVQITSDNEGIIYKPVPLHFQYLAVGESANVTVDYTISDNNGGDDSGVVTITIIGMNDEPIAANDSSSITEDHVTEITLDVLANDSDFDLSDKLSVVEVTSSSPGSFVVSQNSNSVQYTPDTSAFHYLAVGESATVTASYTISDGNGGRATADIFVTITGVNDLVVPVDDEVIAEASETDVLIDVLANDYDIDNSDTITIVGAEATFGIVTVASEGQHLVYSTNGQYDYLRYGESATDTINYIVTDGTSPVIATVTILLFRTRNGCSEATDCGGYIVCDYSVRMLVKPEQIWDVSKGGGEGVLLRSLDWDKSLCRLAKAWMIGPDGWDATTKIATKYSEEEQMCNLYYKDVGADKHHEDLMEWTSIAIQLAGPYSSCTVTWEFHTTSEKQLFEN